MDMTTTTSRDEYILWLVQDQGLSLNAATKRYVEDRKAAGLHTGVVSRKKEAMDLLAGLVTIDLKYWVEHLQDELAVSEGAARDYIKAYVKETGATVKSASSSEAILDWMAERAPQGADAAEWDAFEEELITYMRKELGKSVGNTNEYRKAIRFHRKMVGC